MRFAPGLLIALHWLPVATATGQTVTGQNVTGFTVGVDQTRGGGGCLFERPACAPERLADDLGRSRSHWQTGAAIGFVAGAGITLLILHSGGSTALCNRSANQDALRTEECIGLVALGGVAGAGIGALIGGLIRTGPREQAALDRLRLRAGADGRLVLGLAQSF
jgi:hypothetical protein